MIRRLDPTPTPARRASRRCGVGVALLLALLGLAGPFAPAALAQAARGPSHSVSVEIPVTIGIRLVGSAPRSVAFDYGADLPGYLAAATAGTPLEPTATRGFDDIEIRIPGGRGTPAWYVEVSATPLIYSGSGPGDGLALSDLWVERGASSGLVPEFSQPRNGAVADSWRLGASPQRIAEGGVGTGRWRSLGFNGRDYRLDVQGDEDAGVWRTVVSYTLVAP